MSLCQCGCGQTTGVTRQADTKRGYVRGQHYRFLPGHNGKTLTRKSGYHVRYVQSHPKASSAGDVYEHVLVAEKALGRFLPNGVEIHHVDENQRNNAPSNLVICQDKAYHKLLHVRARIVLAGGNPDIHKLCSRCRRPLPFEAFGARRSHLSTGRQNACRECMNDYRRDRKAMA